MAIAASVWPLQADISLPTVPPPQPEPVLTQDYIGESVDIPLSGVSRSGAGLQFMIRRQPTAGRLSDIRMTGPNTAVVTYTHDAHAGAGVDHFRYAASAPGIGVSTPAMVTVNIIARPASFVAPARMDFPDLAIGHSATQTLVIRNDGGSRIEGRLVVPAPWKIADGGDGSYSLGPGDAAKLAITFTPTEAGQFVDTGGFSHAPGVELGLGGRGYAPIEISPRLIHANADGHNEVRTGSFFLRNVSEDDYDLQIAAPGQIDVPEKVHVPAKSESQITLRTRPGFLGALNGKLTITGKNVGFDTPLDVTAAPARLTVSPESLDFGTLDIGRAGKEKVVVQNVGGTPADVQVKMPEGVSIDPDPSFGPIAPGASQEFTISYARPLPGRLSDTVVIETGEVGLRLPVAAVIKDDGSASALPVAVKGAVTEADYNEIPPVDKIGVTRQTETELDLAWKKAPSAVQYLLFVRTFVFDAQGKPKYNFRRLDRFKVRFVRDEARVTLVGLRPGERIALLIVAVDKDGKASRPSQAFVVNSKARLPFHFPWTALTLVALAGFIVLLVRERRLVRAQSDIEHAAQAESLNR